MRIFFFVVVVTGPVLSPSLFVVVCAEIFSENNSKKGDKNKICFRKLFIGTGKKFMLLLNCNDNAILLKLRPGDEIRRKNPVFDPYFRLLIKRAFLINPVIQRSFFSIYSEKRRGR